MDKEFRDKIDKSQSKLRTEEKHSTKWIKISDIAVMLDLSEDEIMKKVKEFDLHITSDVVSINSRINQNVSKEFVKFITSSN